jgi:hypothetical protein
VRSSLGRTQTHCRLRKQQLEFALAERIELELQ